MEKLTNSQNVILFNKSLESIEIPSKSGNGEHLQEKKSIKKRIKREANKLIQDKTIGDLKIASDSAIKIKRENLTLYDYEPFEHRGDLVLITPDEPKLVFPYKTILNQTARRIEIKSTKDKTGGHLILPAFGSRDIPLSKIKDYNFKTWQEANLIKIEEKEEISIEDKSSKWMPLVAWIGYGWLVSLLVSLFYAPAIVIDSWNLNFSIWWLYPGIAVLIALFTLFILFFKSKKGEFFTNFLVQAINLLILLILGPIGMPIMVMVFFGGILEFFSTPNITNLNAPLLARFIEVILIIVLSIIPGLLYFQFERKKMGVLRTRFIRNIMLLNPKVHTCDDAEILYGKMVDEVSERRGASKKQFAIFSSGRPILLTTLLITLGWIISMWPVGQIVAIEKFDLASFLIPHSTAVNFAFFGAYFFGLNLIFRRYARGDLTPKAYSHIIVRILNAIIIVWVLEATFVMLSGSGKEEGNIILLILAFGIGIVPETGTALLKDLLKTKKFAGWFPSLSVSHPISDLEGISLYDKARLVEEGVESVETLAHHNIIELMLRLGIPISRLVDLFDQAILYLHTTGLIKKVTNSTDKVKRGIDVLRENGIRTATDLLLVIDKLDSSIENPKNSTKEKEVEKKHSFFQLIDPPGDPMTPTRMEIVLEAIKDDEWLGFIKNWRNQSVLEDKIIYDPQEILDNSKMEGQSGDV